MSTENMLGVVNQWKGPFAENAAKSINITAELAKEMQEYISTLSRQASELRVKIEEATRRNEAEAKQQEATERKLQIGMLVLSGIETQIDNDYKSVMSAISAEGQNLEAELHAAFAAAVNR